MIEQSQAMRVSFAPLPDSHFHVPILEDRPQNPILDTLRLTRAVSHTKSARNDIITQEELAATLPENPKRHPPTSRILSWDISPSPSPFLSERGGQFFSAARHVCVPSLASNLKALQFQSIRPYLLPNDQTSASRAQLAYYANMTVLGLSSTWFAWDDEDEKFIPAKIIILEGYDTTLTESLLRPIISNGAMLRRLEHYTHLLTLNKSSAPSLYAFHHAMSEIIGYFREQASHPFTESGPNSFYNSPLTSTIAYFEPFEQTLAILAEMCGRELGVSPSHYPPISNDPSHALSMVYDRLKQEIIVPNRTCTSSSILAYILTCISRPFFQGICSSLEHDPETAPDQEDQDEDREERFPTFFSSELVAAIHIARKSLKLMDTPPSAISLPVVEWVWSTKAVQYLYNIHSTMPASESSASPVIESSLTMQGDYDPAIRSAFTAFDQEPSQYTHQFLPSDRSSLSDFISQFPDRLPSVVPSLEHLAHLVLSPLLHYCNGISNALLSNYLVPPFSTSPEVNLNFHSHATALRSFILCTSPQFSARLENALLSDTPDEGDSDEQFSISALRRIGRLKSGAKKSRAAWPVGLSYDLMMRETWPPYGADLSFSLRTVIVESINELRSVDERNHKIWDDVESRLGFAIKDIGEDEGRWDDAYSIRALDFLYLDYKPPTPLEVLITPNILAKYQRMFSYTLRIRRVNAALTQAYRLIRNASSPPFPTLSETNAKCMHMRSVAQTFMNALSTYVTDMAAGAMFDSFLALLNPISTSSSSSHSALNRADPAFTDVFNLAQRHSDVLDDILAACLLRSGQRAAASLISEILDCILRFSLLVRRLTGGILEEYEAKTHLEDLEEKFRTKTRTLVKVLETLAETKSASNREGLKGGKGMSTNEMWKHLVIRLSLNSWWSRPSGRVVGTIDIGMT